MYGEFQKVAPLPVGFSQDKDQGNPELEKTNFYSTLEKQSGQAELFLMIS